MRGAGQWMFPGHLLPSPAVPTPMCLGTSGGGGLKLCCPLSGTESRLPLIVLGASLTLTS